jgi:DNA polymerase I - 3''-5'' exonuclease and polymerase domains
MSLSSRSEPVNPAEFLSYALLCNTMAIDTETNGKDIRDGRGFCIGISAAINMNDTYYSSYFPVAHTKGNIDTWTKDLLFNLIRTRERIIFHAAKFDTISLETAGYNLGYTRWYCTMMMAHMLNENVPKGLDWLAKNELKEPGKHKPPEWEVMFKIYGWSPDFPAKIMGMYAGEDAVLTLKLFERLYPYFVKSGFDGSQM